MAGRAITIGLTPDPDDAFTMAGLATGKVPVEGLDLAWVVDDLQALNERVRAGELEVAMASAATYAVVADRYRLMDVGAGLGRGPGPILVARDPVDLATSAGRRVAVPGRYTTATLLLRLHARDPRIIELPPERIPAAVLDSEADAGLLVHEGPLRNRPGLTKIADLGEAWRRDTGLPVPLGVTLVRRDVGEAAHARLTAAVRASIAWALAHEDEALAHAMSRDRGLDAVAGRRFVRGFVGAAALVLGSEGTAALTRLFAEARQRGLLDRTPPIDPL